MHGQQFFSISQGVTSERVVLKAGRIGADVDWLAEQLLLAGRRFQAQKSDLRGMWGVMGQHSQYE